MKKSVAQLTLAVLSLASCGVVWAADSVFQNPVADKQMEEAKRLTPQNKMLVERAIKEAKLTSQLPYFVVPAMSDVMRLPWTYPTDGVLNGELKVVAAQNEFEPASFELFSFTDRKDLTISVSALKDQAGTTMPASSVDVKVLKQWFQNGNAWVSYFQDVGLKLVPELLLHDENMVKVNLAEMANYARVKDGKQERFVWISAPAELDPNLFDPIAENFSDADTLQPFSLTKDEFKQFFATVHVPKTQKPGIYQGVITVSDKGNALAKIPLTVRVLPFELPMPMSYFDLNHPVIASIMGIVNRDDFAKGYPNNPELAKKKYKEAIINMRDHGVLWAAVPHDEEGFALLKELGMPTKPIIGHNFIPWYALNFGGRMTYDNVKKAEDAAVKFAEFYTKHLGHTDVLSSYGDEQGNAFMVTHRRAFKPFHQYDAKIGYAGHGSTLYKGGYMFKNFPLGISPDETDKIRPRKEIGDNYIGFYAGQHTGSENPQFVRRQHGMQGYLNNLSLIYNYEFAKGPWNDRATVLYKPMVLSYLNRGGLVDTIQWEGFREAIDDIRYATKLKQLAAEAIASNNIDRKLEGRKVLQYLALLDGSTMDLEVVRAEMINYIIKLLDLAQEKK